MKTGFTEFKKGYWNWEGLAILDHQTVAQYEFTLASASINSLEFGLGNEGGSELLLI
jgi:hypothetical protein